MSRHNLCHRNSAETGKCSLVDLLGTVLKIIIYDRHLLSGYFRPNLDAKARFAGLGGATENVYAVYAPYRRVITAHASLHGLIAFRVLPFNVAQEEFILMFRRAERRKRPGIIYHFGNF